VPSEPLEPSSSLSHEVRGPDPDGDWFVVQIDGDEERTVDETFATESAAQIFAEKLNERDGQVD